MRSFFFVTVLLLVCFFAVRASAAPVDYQTDPSFVESVEAKKRNRSAESLRASVTNLQAVVKSLDPQAFPVGKEREFAKTVKTVLEELTKVTRDMIQVRKEAKP
jgi:ABC-type protease/lipase transport system fused ATPase/permease subunit